MDHSAYLDLGNLNEEARKELNAFLDSLFNKYKLKQKTGKQPKQKRFEALNLDTVGFQFNRAEANER